LYGETIAVGEQLERISQAQVRNGAVLPAEVLRTQVDLQSYRSQQAVARSEAAKSLDQLALLLGQQQHDFMTAGELPVLPAGIDPEGMFDQLYEQALRSRQDLRQLDLRQRQQAELMAAVNAQGKPNINLQFSGAYLGPKSLFGIDAPGISPFNLRLGVGLTYNILGPYAARIKGRELQATQNQLQEQEREARLELATQIKNLLNDLKSQQAALESSQALVDQAQANLALAETSYQHGAVSLLDYTQAQVTATAARAAYEQARFNIAQVLLGLERTVGAQINFSTR
ncbi:MAG TPA: TolC family protein, partial [Rhodothermales bacterium]|nr:TolC family protein [Rhodothermales bacterium]